MIKSPFFIIENAISPAKCELIVNSLGISQPSLNENGFPIKHERIITDAEFNQFLKEALIPHASEIQQKYGAEVDSFTQPLFQQYFEDAKHPCEMHGCDNSRYVRKKWVKTKDTDLVAYLWLKDYNSGVPLDPRFEVYGGKLEFPAHDFSLLPQRGTLIIFPGGPHFITAISPVLVGSLEQIKLSIKLNTTDGTPWLYQPTNFGGTYIDWFSSQE